MKFRIWVLVLALLAGATMGATGESFFTEGDGKPLLSVEEQDELLSMRRLFDTDELINVSGIESRVDGDLELTRVYFEDEVYVGGSEGYWKPWLTANGTVADALVDLDGDGIYEYMTINVMYEQEPTDFYNTIWNDSWTIAIYEPRDGGYELACDFPVPYPWWNQRSIGLTHDDFGTRIIISYSGQWDGGGMGVNAIVYSYNGRSASADAMMFATVGEDSLFIAGPRDPVFVFDAQRVDKNNLPDEAERLNLTVGENLWCYRRYDHDYEGYVFRDDASGSRLIRQAFQGFDEISRVAEEYGIHAFYNLCANTEYGYYSEDYALYVDRGDELLLWMGEGTEGMFNAWADIVSHYEFSPTIRFDESADSLPVPMDVVPEIPEKTDTDFDALEAILQPQGSDETGTQPLPTAGTASITGDVNMRDAPSLSGSVITSIPKGTKVEFLGDISTDNRGVDWYRIRYKNREGWSSSKYTRLD